MKSKKITIGLIQQSCGSNPEDNLSETSERIRQAAKKGARIICLQELFSTQYFCNVEEYTHFSLAEEIPGLSTRHMQKLAAELKAVIIVPLFEKVDPGIYYNTAAVIDADGSYLGKYRKNHIPDDPGFYEKFYFSPGDTGYQVFKTKYAKIGVLICWDQWYPEAARITSLMGADIIFYPTAIGWASSQNKEVNTEQYDAWMTVQRGHAIANGIHVAAVNRTGNEGDMNFWGGSFVADPFGKIIYQARNDKEEIGVVETDLSKSDFYRIHWPFLRDRRIDTYQPIVKRYSK